MDSDPALKSRYLAARPDGVFLVSGDAAALRPLFERNGWLEPDEELLGTEAIPRPSSNFVMRVRTNKRRLVLKQARPWSERAPTKDRSDDGALVEARYGAACAQDLLLTRHHPKLLGVDEPARILLLEDLSPLGDFTDLYQGARATPADLNTLVAYLSALHAMPVDKEPLFERGPLRQERYDELLVRPLLEHDAAELEAETPGMGREAERFRKDERFFEGLSKLGDVFLEESPWLVHGDFRPSNWLRCASGICVVGAEHAMMGRVELDLGFLLGHLMLAGQPSPGWILEEYEPPGEFDVNVALGFAGLEIVHRVLGQERVATNPSLTQKRLLLSLGKELVLRPDRELLG